MVFCILGLMETMIGDALNIRSDRNPWLVMFENVRSDGTHDG